MKNAELVAEENRLEFLPDNIGKHFIAYEDAIMNAMDKHIAEYNGGYYEFYKTDSGAPIMIWSEDPDSEVTVVGDNYYSGKMSPVTASIAVNILIMNLLGWHLHEKGHIDDSKHMFDLYHNLRNWAYSNLDGDQAVELSKFLD
jgi:hypothetical protein